jgi:ubiquinone/menaquinone biosynthesis C-methylase UbiE
MTNQLGMLGQLVHHSVRVGWYFALARILEQQTERHGGRRAVRRSLPAPALGELMRDIGALLLKDAAAVGSAIYPSMHDEHGSPLDYLLRVREMFTDLPGSLARHKTVDIATVLDNPGTHGLPDYFVQDFHFQTGGYLSAQSARLYDVQVETLFMGAAGPMRRLALAAIANYVRGRDQRRLSFVDVACGTGRFLRNVREAFPAMPMTGVDLSSAYLSEARRFLQGLRSVSLVAANAEKLPFESASQDIVSTIFLFHELPAAVRRRVSAEIARILKPAGLLVFVDSLQMGDRPGWDGLLETFPDRFHEPFYRHYVTDDLDGMFADAGLAAVSTETAFLAKIMTRRKD